MVTEIVENWPRRYDAISIRSDNGWAQFPLITETARYPYAAHLAQPFRGKSRSPGGIKGHETTKRW